LHLLALQASDLNLTVEQIALTEAENEISGARRLLEKADLEQKIVSGDAMFAQKELSEKVVEKGGEYLWKLRANQGKMYELAKEHFEKMTDQYLDRASSLEKGHGRIDERAHSDQFPTVGPNRVSVFGASL
jgi:predicted transposase YbfD/YdcC